MTSEFYSIGYPSFSPIDPGLIDFEIIRMKQILYANFEVEKHDIHLNFEKIEITVFNDPVFNSSLVNNLFLTFAIEKLSYNQFSSILESNSQLTLSNFYISDGARVILEKKDSMDYFLSMSSNSAKNDINITLCNIRAIFITKFFVNFYKQFQSVDCISIDDSNLKSHNNLESYLDKSYSLFLIHVPLFRGTNNNKSFNFIFHGFQISIPLIDSYHYSEIDEFDTLLISFSLSAASTPCKSSISDFLNPFYDQMLLEYNNKNEALSLSEFNRRAFFKLALCQNSPWYACQKICFNGILSS